VGNAKNKRGFRLDRDQAYVPPADVTCHGRFPCGTDTLRVAFVGSPSMGVTVVAHRMSCVPRMMSTMPAGVMSAAVMPASSAAAATTRTALSGSLRGVLLELFRFFPGSCPPSHQGETQTVRRGRSIGLPGRL